MAFVRLNKRHVMLCYVMLCYLQSQQLQDQLRPQLLVSTVKYATLILLTTVSTQSGMQLNHKNDKSEAVRTYRNFGAV